MNTPLFGKTETRIGHADGKTDIFKRGFHRGKETTYEHWQQENIEVDDTDKAVAVIVDLLAGIKKTERVAFEIINDPVTMQAKRVTVTRELERKRAA